jgi:hypothetical protein
MIRHRPAHEVLEDLRLALAAMEEDSHRGLDGLTAEVLRSRILNRIVIVEAEIARESALEPTRS